MFMLYCIGNMPTFSFFFLQFFLSRRAIYLLLWNKRLGYEHAGLEFWLNSLSCHCPKAPVFVIGTHADKVEIFLSPHLLKAVSRLLSSLV